METPYFKARIPRDIQERFKAAVKAEGTTMSAVVREAVRVYILEHAAKQS